ncbi:hypothetical protein V5799_009581 [Amblyomma americanum]|uniref:Uncharacterized protein n=1 Tax=Amblyomma americanum TaxID=6943 RepID=A0AAQ4FBK2_AMBAM
MYDPESPTGSPATALKGVNGDSEGSTSEDSKSVDKGHMHWRPDDSFSLVQRLYGYIRAQPVLSTTVPGLLHRK